jgi:hypothetical protein
MACGFKLSRAPLPGAARTAPENKPLWLALPLGHANAAPLFGAAFLRPKNIVLKSM